MTTPSPHELSASVWEALAAIADPEIPAVSVVDMGMIETVDVHGGTVRIVILPTFTGCPALPVIKKDVLAAASAIDGIGSVSVETSFEPPWTSDRITPGGKAKLRRFGIAPPSGEGPVIVTQIGLPRTAGCPFCGSKRTVVENAFGPTPCRALYYCKDCRNPFEQFKAV